MIYTPKYMEIVEWTVEQISAEVFKPNDKFLSETKLGEKFGFSRQTVRRALEVLEQQGYISRIQGSGSYVSSRKPHLPALDREHTMTVGIISTYLDNYIFPSIVRGIEGVLSSCGYAVQLASTNNSVEIEARSLQLMAERRVDGLIIVPTRSALPCANLDLYNSLIHAGTPMVFVDSFYPELSIPYVSLDDVAAGYSAAKHLISKGHRNICGIFSHINRQGHLRYLGYVRALKEHGISIQEDRIFWYSKESLQQLLHGSGFLDQLSGCTAALCFNDHMALRFIDYLRQNGRNIPEDLSVVGIDNSEPAKIASLTSINHPSEELGQAAAKLLLSLINGSEGKNVLFPPQLQIRGSVRQLENENVTE